MIKKFTYLTLLTTIIFLGISCEETITLTKPSVTAQIEPNGGAVKFTWTAVEGAQGYHVYRDTVKISISGLTYTETIPAKVIKITAYKGNTESEAYIYDCTPVITDNVEVYFMSDPNPAHPSGFGFKANGQAQAFSVTTNANDVDYTVEDRYERTTKFFSPNAYTPAINPKKNMTNDPSISQNFDNLNMALAPGSYITQREIAVDGVYALFMDRDNDGWDTSSDYFAKVWVKNIDQANLKVTLKCAFQPRSGLRWLVTK
ncbi:MAG: hypothetical protein ABIK19_05820 [candidate division WOR-3 bacterium]